jgi:hypothetical protein
VAGGAARALANGLGFDAGGQMAFDLDQLIRFHG